MKTKEEELKILAKIEKLIQEAGGDDSYIGMAFAGACDDARDNIKWDMGCSYMDRYECKCKEAEDMERHLTDLVNEKDREILNLQNALEAATTAAESWKSRYDDQFERREAAEKDGCRILGELSEAKAGEEWEEARADQAELELMKLKAKLYDKMMEEGE